MIYRKYYVRIDIFGHNFTVGYKKKTFTMFWSMHFYYPAVAKCFSYQMKDDYVALGPFFFHRYYPLFIDQLFLG